MGTFGEKVDPPQPSASSELAISNEPLKPIVAPKSSEHPYPPADIITIAPTADTSLETSTRAPPGWPREKEAFVEQARRVPVIRTVGQDTILVCGVKSPGAENEVKWDKIGGNMPFKFRIDRGDLIIEDLRKEDEGLYQCSLSLPGRDTSIFFTDLKVAGKTVATLMESKLEFRLRTGIPWKLIHRFASVDQ